jgi:AcrR family transcriptional regulator
MTSGPLVRTTEPAADGRHRRGQDSRARIVAALFELVQAGEVAPSAEQVAVQADVGLRTVFRHFKDMDSLYAEISQAMAAILMARADQPFKTQDARARVIELVERRAGGFERIAPFMDAAATSRHRSPVLQAEAIRLASSLREILLRELPKDVAADSARVEALDLLLSFESWSRLRRQQGLSAERAREVLEAAVRQILG